MVSMLGSVSGSRDRRGGHFSPGRPRDRASNLVRLPDGDVAAVGAGHGPLNQEQVVGRIDLDNLEVADRDLGMAHMSRFANPFLGTRRIGTGARRARMAVHSLDTVRGPQTTKPVPLHHAREPPALAR